MINWKVRFSRKNLQFIIRFIASLLIPVLAYMGIKVDDITSWPIVGELLINFISNPFLVVLTIINAINIVPDPTTAGLGDSRQAMRYLEPKNDKNYL
ncbi:phage holin [Bacillus sp. FJAT-27225]|uniref:phage holin n=1 Tax=Bacillus sp. FJAT-27225 TaxID=1743144 RepID=UPI00080C3570|nr:phage holin [Bacillus sp. FJAT-27225]OCA84478.1 phage holin [Bacillus sp. FJAT-27225]